MRTDTEICFGNVLTSLPLAHVQKIVLFLFEDFVYLFEIYIERAQMG